MLTLGIFHASSWTHGDSSVAFPQSLLRDCVPLNLWYAKSTGVADACCFLPLHFSRYWVFRSWGRVGTVIGSKKLEKMPSKEDAVEHFLNLYEEKTGNSWHSKNFTKYPKKFYPLEIDYGQVTQKCPWPRWSIAEIPCCHCSVLCLLLDHLHLTNLGN